jgi:MFS family permease
MTYYVVYIFAMAGLKGNIKLISSGVQYALFIIFSSIMFFFVDKIGRRTLLVWGAVAMGICHLVVAGMLGGFYTYVPEGVGGDKNVVMSVEGSPAYTVIAFSYLLIIVSTSFFATHTRHALTPNPLVLRTYPRAHLLGLRR